MRTSIFDGTDSGPTPGPGPDRDTITIMVWQLVVIAVAVLAFVVFTLPTLHGILYEVLLGTPGFVQWSIVAVALVAVGVYRRSTVFVTAALAVFVVMALLVGPIAGGVYAHTDMANQMQTDADDLDTLPNTSQENVRVLPRSVSDNYAQSSMQYPQYRLTESDIAYQDGRYAWSYGLTPDNFMVAWFGNQRGALYVNMTTTSKEVAVEDAEFRNGRGQLFFDSYRYQSVLANPTKQHNWHTTFNARANGTSYISHSTTAYEWKWRWAPVPQFYAVPKHGSVEMMYTDGTTESLSPEEAHESELLRGQNYYPYHIAMFKVESMQYVHGALNKWFWKEDVLAIADLPEDGNEWPLTVPTETDNGEPELTYFIATEPAGGGDGVYEVWTVDSRTGDAGVMSYSESQIGPQKAIDFVERHPEVNRLSNAEAVSPIPIVKGDALYWHVKVVPGSRSGVVYTAFVNAQSGDVTLIEGDSPIYAFLRSDELEDVKELTNQTGSNTTDGSGVEVTIVVTNEGGEIVRTENVTVPAGGGVQVEVEDADTNSTRPANTTTDGETDDEN